MSASTICAPHPVYSPPLHRPPHLPGHPLCVPPLVARTPFPPCPASPCFALPALPRPVRPPLCAHAGGAGGTVRHPPSFRFAGSGAICPAAPHPGCTPSTPFARTLGAGRTERPPSLSVHEKAPPPGLLPPSLHATRRVHALPHPLLECGGRDRRDSVHPPFHSPLLPSYATPIPRRTSPHLTSPHPPPSPFAHMPGRHKGQCPPFPFAVVPSTQAAPLPPLFGHHARTPFCVHAGSAGGMGVHTRGGPCRGCHMQGGHVAEEGHVQWDRARGAMHQWRTAHEGRGHRTMGGATQEANSGGAKGV